MAATKHLIFYLCRQCKNRFSLTHYQEDGAMPMLEVLTHQPTTQVHNCEFGDLGVADLTGIRPTHTDHKYRRAKP